MILMPFLNPETHLNPIIHFEGAPWVTCDSDNVTPSMKFSSVRQEQWELWSLIQRDWLFHREERWAKRVLPWELKLVLSPPL